MMMSAPATHTGQTTISTEFNYTLYDSLHVRSQAWPPGHLLPALRKEVMASITAARRSKAPACAPCHIMANSPDTLYTARGWVGNWRETNVDIWTGIEIFLKVFSNILLNTELIQTPTYALFIIDLDWFGHRPCLWLLSWCPDTADLVSPSPYPLLLSRLSPATENNDEVTYSCSRAPNIQTRASTYHGSNGESSCSRRQLIATSVPKCRFGLCSISVRKQELELWSF